MDFPAFPKVFSIGHRQISNIFDGEVEITEKLDGSQFAFAKIQGQLVCRSRGKILDFDYPDQLFAEGIQQVQKIAYAIPDNWAFYGELLKKPKHNTLKYARVPTGHIALFGYNPPDNTHLYSYSALCTFAKNFGMDVVPRIYQGIVKNVDDLLGMLDRESFLGGTKIEGIVVKNWNKSFLIGGQYFFVMSGKYVSEKFKEVHQNWSKSHTSKGKWQDFIDSFRTEARWEKAIQHLRERGELLGEPKDIGSLIKEINQDIIEEEKEYILEQLWKFFSKDILRIANRGFPEWYKQKLLEGAFNE